MLRAQGSCPDYVIAGYYYFSALSIERIHHLYHPLVIGYPLSLQYGSNTAIDTIDSRLIQGYTPLFILVFHIQEAYCRSPFHLILTHFLLILLVKLAKSLRVDNVTISIEPHTIKLFYQIKDFVRIGHGFASLISPAAIEFISYIIAHYYRPVEIVTQVERATTTISTL